MKSTWPISRNIILTALVFGAATLTVAETGLKIPLSGSVNTDPRELLITVGAALTGPIGGIIIGLMSIPWFSKISALNFPTLIAHISAGFFIGLTYKKLVYQRMDLPWLLFGWAGLVLAYYSLILIPVYIVVFSKLDPVTFVHNFGDISSYHVYATLIKLAAPEIIITVVITTIIILALPPKYRCPLWSYYDGSKVVFKNNFIAIRLMIWLLLLSALPLATVVIFVFHSVNSGFDLLTIDHQKEQAQLLATALSNSAAPQSISSFQKQYLTTENNFDIIDLTGQYLIHRDHSKIGTSMKSDFTDDSVELILSGKTNAFFDERKERVVGYAKIKGQKKIVVISSVHDYSHEIVSSIYRSSQLQLAISFLIISIVGGVVIWLIVGRPVRQLTQFAQQVGKGHLDITLDPGDAVDELQVLSLTFNEMAYQLGHLVNGLKEKVRELEETEKRLRHSENQYRSLNDNIPIGVFRSTLDGKVLSYNAALLQMMNVEDETSTDITTTIPFYKNQEDRIAILTEIQNKKQINGFECQMKSIDGNIFWASISVRSIEGSDGRIKYVDGIIEDISERKKAIQARKASEAMLRALSIKLQEVEEAHRKEISRELHDRVGQNLTALNINLNLLYKQLQPEGQGRVNARLMDSIDLVEKTTVTIRDVMAELRPQVLDDYGLAASLRWYRERFSKRTGIQIDLETNTIEDIRFPEKVETALFRITQEALNNVVKHACATSVTIIAEKVPGAVHVTITDDGQGFDIIHNKSSQDLQHWGLIHMQERAEALDGQLKIESESGQGTRLRVDIPV